jgi:hypothetical protein
MEPPQKGERCAPWISIHQFDKKYKSEGKLLIYGIVNEDDEKDTMLDF